MCVCVCVCVCARARARVYVCANTQANPTQPRACLPADATRHHLCPLRLPVSPAFDAPACERPQVISLAARGEQKTLTQRLASFSNRLELLGVAARENQNQHQAAQGLRRRAAGAPRPAQKSPGNAHGSKGGKCDGGAGGSSQEVGARERMGGGVTGGTAMGDSGSAYDYLLSASQGEGGVVGSGGGRRKAREQRRVERQEAAARLANTPIGHTKRRELDRQTGQLAIAYYSPKADARRELVEGRFAQGLSEVNKTAALAWQLSSPTRAGGSGDAEKGRYAIGSASAGARMSAGSGQL